MWVCVFARTEKACTFSGEHMLPWCKCSPEDCSTNRHYFTKPQERLLWCYLWHLMIRRTKREKSLLGGFTAEHFRTAAGDGQYEDKTLFTGFGDNSSLKWWRPFWVWCFCYAFALRTLWNRDSAFFARLLIAVACLRDVANTYGFKKKERKEIKTYLIITHTLLKIAIKRKQEKSTTSYTWAECVLL